MSDLQTTVSPATTIGRYRVVGLIAHGGMGSLYLARDPAIDRTIAIKLLRKEFDDEATRERFAREARATGHLRHPNIVTVFDVGDHDQRPFIAMEYVPGETLAQLIRRRAPLSIADRLAILEDLCVGLHFAHSKGFIHRDIKPANVILDVSGTIKILDFGLAHASDSAITNAGDQLGTLNYMSPEQVVGGPLDHRSDVYAVGVLAYELMSYTKAFPGTMQDGTIYRILHTNPTPLETVVPGLDPEISRIIERAMFKEPAQRHQDADYLREDFAALRKRLMSAEAPPARDVEANAIADATDTDAAGGPIPLTPVVADRSGRHALAGIARDSTPVTADAIASSAKTVATGSAGETPAPTRAVPRQRRRLVLAGVTATALTVILAAAFYKNASQDRAPTEAVAGPQPPAIQSASDSAPAPSTPTSTTGDAAPGRRAIDERLSAIRASARQQMAAAQHPQLLNTLSAGLILDPGDEELNGLIDELKSAALQRTAQARSNAARRGATENSSLEFRDARAREREGEALNRSGDRAQAIRALWAATELYGRASTVTAQRTAPAPTLPPAVQPPVAKIEAPPLPERRTPPVPPPTAAPDAEKPPQPASPVRAEPSVPAAVDAVGDARTTDVAAIEEALRRYAVAYRSLDIAAVRKVLPSLNAQQLRNLENDFSNYRSYAVEVADPRIAVDHETATARCQVTRSFVTRTGVAGGHTVATTFHLRKIDAIWVIERVESR